MESTDPAAGRPGEPPAPRPPTGSEPVPGTLDEEPAGTAAPAPADRPAELRVARLHLRTGSYALARAELEALAGAGRLDDEALLDLAEVRWRTDDLTGAGEAAAAYIASGRVAVIALVVAAEATSALGRPGEARRLAARVLELVDGSIDPIFAGMPRSDVWPTTPAQRVPSVTVAGSAIAGSPVAGGADRVPSAGVAVAAAGATAATPAATSAGAAATAPAASGGAAILGAGVAVPMDAGPGVREAGEPMPDPAAELVAARAALAAGDRSGAAIRLSVVLRLAPALAPAVLDVAAAEPGRDFDLVRGDALRLVGRESQARRAFAAAARQPAGDGHMPPADADAHGASPSAPGAEPDQDR